MIRFTHTNRCSLESPPRGRHPFEDWMAEDSAFPFPFAVSIKNPRRIHEESMKNPWRIPFFNKQQYNLFWMPYFYSAEKSPEPKIYFLLLLLYFLFFFPSRFTVSFSPLSRIESESGRFNVWWLDTRAKCSSTPPLKQGYVCSIL